MKKHLCFILIILAGLMAACTRQPSGMHTMPDGSVMHNETAMPGMHAMPDGSVMHNETAMPGMHGMGDSAGHAMEPISAPTLYPAQESQERLAYTQDGAVKVFNLTTQAVQWSLTDGVTVTAFTYNGSVPGPEIRVTEGDTVRVIVKNELPEPTTIHWHGMDVPFAMDGVPDMPNPAIQPGETFTYEFVAKSAGTFMYHSHYNSEKQVGAGLYAPFIVEPVGGLNPKPVVDLNVMLSEWRVVGSNSYTAMPMAGMEPNYFTINGKSFPNTLNITVKRGELVRLRFMGIGQFIHPMHLHGSAFKIVATDGHPVPTVAQLTKDTVSIAPGERYDVEFVANEVGEWMLHCHILHHTSNDHVEPGGMMMVIKVVE